MDRLGDRRKDCGKTSSLYLGSVPRSFFESYFGPMLTLCSRNTELMSFDLCRNHGDNVRFMSVSRTLALKTRWPKNCFDKDQVG